MANVPGDYLIRRNNAETDSITTANFDSTWDTEVASNGSSISYSAGTFTLAAGKYLVTYSEFFNTSDTTDNERFEVQSRLVIGGSQTVFGAGQGYIRKQSGHQECIPHGYAIIDIPSDSTSLVVRFFRSDDSTTGTCVRVSDWGGVCILALDDTWNYARYSRSSTVTLPDAFADIVWQDNDEQDTGFSRSSGEITITDAGRYLVTYSLPWTITSTTDRSEAVSRLTLDDAEVAGSRVSTYVRGNDSCQSGCHSWAGIIDVAASDVLALETSYTDGTATKTLNANANIEIVQLPSGNETIIIEATSGNWNSTGLSFTWDTVPHNDTAAFTHTAGTAGIEVDNDGDYFVFATFASTSCPTRCFPAVRFRHPLTDSARVNYIAAGEYGRNSGANDPGTCAAGLITGLSATDEIFVSTDFFAGAGVLTTAFAQFSALRLDSIFSGSASITGTSAMTLPLPTMSATGEVGNKTGTSAMTLPVPTMAATGTVGSKTGTAASTLPLPTMGAAGKLTYKGTAASTLPLPTMSAAGKLTYKGAAASTLPVPTMSASGLVGSKTGTSAMTLPLPTMAASGGLTYKGTSAPTLPLPTMTASGTLTASPTKTGTSEMTLLLPVMTAVGYSGSDAPVPLPDPASGPQASVLITEVQDATFRLTLEAPASRQRPAKLLFTAIITNPKLNEPIRLDGQHGSVMMDMIPVVARLRLLAGDAANFVDAKVVIRARRRLGSNDA